MDHPPMLWHHRPDSYCIVVSIFAKTTFYYIYIFNILTIYP